jgi:hypothetical protein
MTESHNPRRAVMLRLFARWRHDHPLALAAGFIVLGWLAIQIAVTGCVSLMGVVFVLSGLTNVISVSRPHSIWRLLLEPLRWLRAASCTALRRPRYPIFA